MNVCVVRICAFHLAAEYGGVGLFCVCFNGWHRVTGALQGLSDIPLISCPFVLALYTFGLFLLSLLYTERLTGALSHFVATSWSLPASGGGRVFWVLYTTTHVL